MSVILDWTSKDTVRYQVTVLCERRDESETIDNGSSTGRYVSIRFVSNVSFSRQIRVGNLLVAASAST